MGEPIFDSVYVPTTYLPILNWKNINCPTLLSFELDAIDSHCMNHSLNSFFSSSCICRGDRHSNSCVCGSRCCCARHFCLLLLLLLHIMNSYAHTLGHRNRKFLFEFSPSADSKTERISILIFLLYFAMFVVSRKRWKVCVAPIHGSNCITSTATHSSVNSRTPFVSFKSVCVCVWRMHVSTNPH